MQTTLAPVIPIPADLEEDLDLRTRMRAEFAEMPGLRLTLLQASRLFNVEPARCESALRALVALGELSNDRELFGRAAGLVAHNRRRAPQA